MPTKEKILIELSGGVDSAAAAYLLKQQGYNCVGTMMKLHNSSSLESEINNANEICKKLKIPFELIDFQNEFKEKVINYFIETYKVAKTPNPCVECNKHMKFGIMFEVAKSLGCTIIATGHYAQIIKEDDEYQLLCAKDQSKDQSYFIHFLNQIQLSKIIFPLGNLTKNQSKKIAKEAGFEFTDQKESQDICFIKDGDYKNFILENSEYSVKQGKVINAQGQELGQHQGLINYTIGQRKGLGIASSEPLYVLSLNNKNNTVTLGTKTQSYTNFVNVKNFTFISDKQRNENFECSAKLRYRQVPQKCMAQVLGNNKIKLEFKQGISAVAPGQFAVLYDENKVLGGGIIT